MALIILFSILFAAAGAMLHPADPTHAWVFVGLVIGAAIGGVCDGMRR